MRHLTAVVVDAGDGFLRFEPLSFVPIQADLCDPEAMDEEDKRWLREYNHACVEKMKPLIQEPEVIQWLEEQAAKADALFSVCWRQLLRRAELRAPTRI